MKLLAGTHYDPTTAATKATSALQAMTALDTTNLRLTFKAPSSGTVLVRLRGNITGATTSPSILLGVLDGATVRGRSAPLTGHINTSATNMLGCTTSFLVTGLTPGTSYTWDAAYGVEFAVASSAIKYGGPDNATANNAFGSFAFEIWDAQGLLAGTHYDPTTAVAVSAASLIATTAIDTTNLRLTFVAPSSGNVMVRIRAAIGNATSLTGTVLFAVLDGATVKSRVRAVGGLAAIDTSALATQISAYEGILLITGLTPGTSYTWDAAYSVETALTGGSIEYGGPDNATQNDAWGGFSYDIWNVDDLPRAIGQAA